LDDEVRATDMYLYTRHHESACQPSHRKVGWSISGRAPGQSGGERGRKSEERRGAGIN